MVVLLDTTSMKAEIVRSGLHAKCGKKWEAALIVVGCGLYQMSDGARYPGTLIGTYASEREAELAAKELLAKRGRPVED